MNPETLLNPDVFRRLVEDLGGDLAVVPDLLESLEADSVRSIREMRQALAQNDQHQLRRAAHRLKGSIATFGAVVAESLCRDLESFSISGQLGDAGTFVDELERVSIDSIAALRAAAS